MVRLLPLLLVGCTTLEGLGPSQGLQALIELEDPTRVQGGRLALDRDAMRWVLTTTLAARCQPGCRDEDFDGLDDGWEAVALDRLRPALALRFDEPSFADGTGGLVSLGRAAIIDGRITVIYVFLWDEDAGRCSVGRHHGDAERVIVQLSGDARRHEIDSIYTSAHEFTRVDASRVVSGRELASLWTHADGDSERYVIQVAAGKHGLYPFDDGVCPTGGSMCLRDLCSGLPHPYPIVLAVHDVGEPWSPRVLPLPMDPWYGGAYCGLGGRKLVLGCGGSVAEKLEVWRGDTFLPGDF